MDGVDKRTGRASSLPREEARDVRRAFAQFKRYWQDAVGVLTLDDIQHDLAEQLAVINSLLKPDCLEKATTWQRARLPLQCHVQHRIGRHDHTVNSLAALKKIVFDEKIVTLAEYRTALVADFGSGRQRK